MNPSELFRNASPRVFRRMVYLFPPIRRCGVKIDRISDDWTEWDIRLPLTYRTRNYVGTQWGGGMAAAADPWFMIAWMHILGPEYVVWDKAANIRYLRPGRSTLTGTIRITHHHIKEIIERCEEEPKLDDTFTFQWLDAEGQVVCEVDKVLHFRKKRDGDRGYDS